MSRPTFIRCGRAGPTTSPGSREIVLAGAALEQGSGQQACRGGGADRAAYGAVVASQYEHSLGHIEPAFRTDEKEASKSKHPFHPRATSLLMTIRIDFQASTYKRRKAHFRQFIFV